MLKFSVVIPTCQREDLLARCLESLRPGVQLADPASYEVIVTDDARGTTAEAMMRSQFPWARWVKGPARGPAANRNSGVKHATGEWACFIDDDCIASKQWISALGNHADDKAIDLMEGRTNVPDNSDNPFAFAASNEKGGCYWSCNLAVRRSRFLELGGFDEDFLEATGEDMEFAHRYHARHFRSQFHPEALVYHPVRPVGWRSIWNRLFSIRWSALYAFKIDKDLHLSDSPAKNIFRAFTGMIMNQLRKSFRYLTRWDMPGWRKHRLMFVLQWVTLPLVLPYHLYWVYQFQRQLQAKTSDRGVP